VPPDRPSEVATSARWLVSSCAAHALPLVLPRRQTHREGDALLEHLVVWLSTGRVQVDLRMERLAVPPLLATHECATGAGRGIVRRDGCPSYLSLKGHTPRITLVRGAVVVRV
jgi:hypothetical protein